ncbi:MAG TPA: response regulator transcription factor [Flavitalea sp.]|nr:response regulator transcription factor [Flavitalea sp.]
MLSIKLALDLTGERKIDPIETFKRKFHMVKLIIADDHHMVREAWALLLSRDPRVDIVATCENGERAIAICKELQPDVVLMDINMEPVNGIDATRAIRQFSSQIKIIGISVHTDLPYLNALMQAGANGYVTKNSPCEEMIKAIMLVADGEKYFCREIVEIQRNGESERF